jgi:hypothetical protein
MEREHGSYDGFSNHETWAHFVLLTYCEESLAFWLAEAEACRVTLARRLLAMNGPGDGGLGLHVHWDEIARQLLAGDIPTRGPRFPLGRLVVAPRAYGTLSPLDRAVAVLLHSRGTWGEIGEVDAEENELALRDGGFLFSAYHAADGTRFYVITKADRSATTVQLPGEC